MRSVPRGTDPEESRLRREGRIHYRICSDVLDARATGGQGAHVEPISLVVAVIVSLAAKSSARGAEGMLEDEQGVLRHSAGRLRDLLANRGAQDASEALDLLERAPDSRLLVEKLAVAVDRHAVAEPPFTAELEQLVAEARVDGANIESIEQVALDMAKPIAGVTPWSTITRKNTPPTRSAGVDSDGEAVQPTRFRRFLHGRAPERIALGEVASLQVRMVAEPTGGRNVELKPMDIPTNGVDILLILHHPGFEARSPVRCYVHLPPDGPSDWRLFEVEAGREGIHSLIVSAFREGSFLGELTFQLTVEADLSPGRSVDVRGPVHSLMAADGEVSLLINFDAEKQLYTFQFLSSDKLDEGVTSNRLLTPPKAAVEALVRELNGQARATTRLSADKTRRWLQGKGVGLWEDLVPEAVRRQFWERRERIKSLTIVSARDLVPWELLYPLGASPHEDAGFLAEQFPVMRWVYGGAKIQQLRGRDAAFVMPEGSPTTAATEIAAVRTLLGASEGKPISSLDALLDRLDAGDFGVLHFACHNTFDAAGVDRSTVKMTDDPFELSFLNPLKVQQTLRGRAPLVFMNACRSAGTGEHYTEMTGWAQAFVQAGAGAFIGSLWEVRDATATDFAAAFYEAMFATPTPGAKQATLGEAVQHARAAICNRAGDPTWLAYTVYGSPGAVAA